MHGIITAKTPLFDWSSDMVDRLRELWDEGHTALRIAGMMDPTGVLTRNAVLGKTHRLGFPGRPKAIPQNKGHSYKKRVHTKKTDAQKQFKRPPTFRALPFTPASFVFEGDKKTFSELEAADCRWVVNESDNPSEFLFCGRPKVCGLPYCVGHARIAYRGR